MVHKSVLLNEVITFLDPRPGDFVIDGTVDGGGHARAILAKIGATGIFLGVDLDKEMVAKTEENILSNLSSNNFSLRAMFRQGNYGDLPEILEKEQLGKADGLLLDLGFSSEQLEHSKRGFSFSDASAAEPLLMTYSDSETPVYELLRSLSEKELANIIFEFGGERLSRRIAKAIIEHGRQERILTAGQLRDVVRSALPGNYEHGRIDRATRTFQALRIYANGELKNLSRILENLETIIKPGGRVVILSFHSLEDRLVKQAFQKIKQAGKAELLTKKPVIASVEEIGENPRSRSAKLRAIKIANSE